MSYRAICKCGYHSDETRDKTRAEVEADTHETRNIRRAYAEDAGNWSGAPLVGGNVGGDARMDRRSRTSVENWKKSPSDMDGKSSTSL